VRKSIPVILSEDFMILRLTTVHENPGSAGILPAVAGHRALDDVAGRMPALPFSWQRTISAVSFGSTKYEKTPGCFASLSMTESGFFTGSLTWGEGCPLAWKGLFIHL
jgi:hypothetical protein